MATYPHGILSHLRDGPTEVPAWVAAAQARPGRMTYGFNGPTTTTNAVMMMVLERLGVTCRR